MTAGPLSVYQARVDSGALRSDPAQMSVVRAFQSLHDALGSGSSKSGLKGLFKKKVEGPKGLYLWGGVGRGKSMLMDLFFDTAPVDAKRRVHFHAFMQEIHDGLNEARAAGYSDPVQVVADAVIRDAKLLCFDELQITDITDAMIVGRLFDKLFAEGVVVVTTSNRVPQDLYKDGLNRKLFLPFIDLIEERLDILQLDSETDHRQEVLANETLYVSPLGPEADAKMDALWGQISGGGVEPLVLSNKGREVVIPKYSNRAGRADFADFCEKALGPSDFLMVADAVAVLMIENVPRLSREKNNEAKRFVTLIDALYEAGTLLILSAAAEPDDLYEEGPGAFEFERTASRLTEMRSATLPAG